MSAKRTDSNQADIVAALRMAGCGVIDIHEIGHDIPDLIVAFRDGMDTVTLLMECKSPGGRSSQGQRNFREVWPGIVLEVWSAEDALRQIGKA